MKNITQETIEIFAKILKIQLHQHQNHCKKTRSMPRWPPAKIQELVCADDAIATEVKNLGEVGTPFFQHGHQLWVENGRNTSKPQAFCGNKGPMRP
jgi:hypothetical protein